MMSEERPPPNTVNWDRFGLGDNTRQSPGSPEAGYGPGGHRPVDRDEIYADEYVGFTYLIGNRDVNRQSTSGSISIGLFFPMDPSRV